MEGKKIKVSPKIDDDLNCLVNRKTGRKILSRWDKIEKSQSNHCGEYSTKQLKVDEEKLIPSSVYRTHKSHE